MLSQRVKLVQSPSDQMGLHALSVGAYTALNVSVVVLFLPLATTIAQDAGRCLGDE